MRGKLLANTQCPNDPSDRCYTTDCPDIMTCDKLKHTRHFYPVAETRRHCQYTNAAGIRCSKLAYYWILAPSGLMEYRCYYDTPIGLRTPANNITTMKANRP